MSMLYDVWIAFWVFLRIAFVGFGGGYAMLSLIMDEVGRLNISILQFADLNALDMIVPGPIMVNAATYVGYIHAGLPGALSATIASAIPSFIYVSLVMRFMARYKGNHLMADILSGIKPAAVGLIAAAAMTIAWAVIFPDGSAKAFFTSPLTFAAILPGFIFVGTAIANIRFRINPILLTVAAGILGAILL